MEEKVKSARTSIEEQWKLLETRILETLRLGWIEIQDQLNQLETEILTERKRITTPAPDPKNMELRFSNKISQPVLTCHEIKGEDNNCIQLVLLDSPTRNIVDIGPVASASVEIVVLGEGNDDWTGEEFNEKIVRIEGKLPILKVDVCKLQGGIGVLENFKFRHHATEVKPSVFRLGARIVEKFDRITVKEAKTESFVVKCYRNKYSKKNEIPYLSDKICVLKNIQHRGRIFQRLQDKGIDTVEKFLIQLLRNHRELENTTGLKGKKWEATVNHARKCESDKMFWYMNSQENSGVVFDIFGVLQLMYSEGEHFATNMLSENKKVDADKLLSSAFEHWDDVASFNDPDSLQQHLASIKTSFDPSNSRIPGHPSTNPNIGASEMIDEFFDFEFPNPLSCQETLNFDRPSTDLDDSFYGFIEDFPSPVLDQQASLYLGAMPPDFDIGCVVYGARTDGSVSTVSAESKVVPGKWKTLFFCVSRLILIRKRLNSEANPARKKQKIC